MDHTGISSSVWPFGFLHDKYRLSFSFSFQKQRLWGEVSLYQLLACSGCGQALSLWGILFFFHPFNQINHQSITITHHILLISTLLSVFVFCWSTVSCFRSLFGIRFSRSTDSDLIYALDCLCFISQFSGCFSPLTG